MSTCRWHTLLTLSEPNAVIWLRAVSSISIACVCLRCIMHFTRTSKKTRVVNVAQTTTFASRLLRTAIFGERNDGEQNIFSLPLIHFFKLSQTDVKSRQMHCAPNVVYFWYRNIFHKFDGSVVDRRQAQITNADNTSLIQIDKCILKIADFHENFEKRWHTDRINRQ